jgi:GLPGLI family protein
MEIRFMKNKFWFLSFLLLTVSVSAQKKFSEGTISYDVVITTGSDKPKNADFLDGTTVVNYIKADKSRTEMVSPLGTLTTVYDGSKNAIVILKDIGEQKYMITLSANDWKDANKKYEGMSFSYEDGEKTILDYKCKKAVAKLQDGTTYTVWYTPDLVPENKNFQYETRSLPGLAMEYETTNSKGEKTTYTVSKISYSPVPVSKFDLPKSGYRVMTYAESKSRG